MSEKIGTKSTMKRLSMLRWMQFSKNSKNTSTLGICEGEDEDVPAPVSPSLLVQVSIDRWYPDENAESDSGDDDDATGGITILVHGGAEPLGPLAGIVVGRVGLGNPERIEVEGFVEIGVAPLLQLGSRHGRALIHVPSMGAPRLEPLRLVDPNTFHGGGADGLGYAVHQCCLGHPTDSAVSVIRRILPSPFR